MAIRFISTTHPLKADEEAFLKSNLKTTAVNAAIILRNYCKEYRILMTEQYQLSLFDNEILGNEVIKIIYGGK